ncbi:MAG: hypothetical protein HQL14_06360 [Candidatus Omnitrophica bacterium]|nr:hypothetical protein [Candidatus Omnitrophota bacterium]
MKKIVMAVPSLLCGGLLLAHPSFAAVVDKSWQQLKGEDFIVYYRADVPDDFVRTTMDCAENELRRVVDNLGIVHYENWSLDHRASIYIYSDQGDFVKNGRQALWSHGTAFARSKMIKTFPEAEGFFDAILPHELGHIIFREFVGFSTEIPLWFEEGMAMNQEKAKRWGANRTVKEAIKNGSFIPLSKLSHMRLYMNSKQELVGLFYAESASIVYFMITELGEQQFFMFCRELKNNMPFDVALKKVYSRFKNLDELNQFWVDYLEG